MTALPEAPSRMEPCLPDAVGEAILDLVARLSAAAATLGARLHPRTAAGLADTVRIMNCYYSNLIEGHNTTPREIARALAGELDPAPERRDLMLEARAHIGVQREIDRQHAAGTLADPSTVDFIAWLHRAFYADASPAMLTIGQGDLTHRMAPGHFRDADSPPIAVGRHLPPDGAAVAAFMAHFARRYRFAGLGMGQRIIAIAAAHHRLNYIHPFPDGNGRVSRLMSHAMAQQAGIGAHGLWSVSRGLARGLDSRTDYKRMMDHADQPRQGDLDGRGNLSRRALEEFIAWFLAVCLDQVTFMAGLFALDTLAARLRRHVDRQGLRPEAFALLMQVLQRGEMPRGEAAAATGLGVRSASTLVATLTAQGLLGSDTPKAPVSLRFPPATIEALFPALFPET